MWILFVMIIAKSGGGTGLATEAIHVSSKVECESLGSKIETDFSSSGILSNRVTVEWKCYEAK